MRDYNREIEELTQRIAEIEAEKAAYEESERNRIAEIEEAKESIADGAAIIRDALVPFVGEANADLVYSGFFMVDGKPDNFIDTIKEFFTMVNSVSDIFGDVIKDFTDNVNTNKNPSENSADVIRKFVSML